MSASVLILPYLMAALSFALVLIYLRRDEAIPPPLVEAKPAERNLLSTEPVAGNSDMRRQLAQAGYDHPNAMRYFLYAKLIGAVLGLLIGLTLLNTVPAMQDGPPVQRMGVMLLGAVLGYFIPVTFIDKKRGRFKNRIQLALPDALDFMLICVEAGQSTDVAVKRVAEEIHSVHPDLAQRFTALTEALAAGAERQDAWLKIAAETENDDLRQLATIIGQSTNMGTPIGQTLRVFASDLRDQRVRRVEERANVLPTKMTLGTMMFTIPPLMILLLTPSIYRIVSSF